MNNEKVLNRILSIVTRIDIGHLVPGIYLVRINANGTIVNGNSSGIKGSPIEHRLFVILNL